MDIDWRLAGNANPFAEFAQGYQTGRENKFQRERVDAYKADTDARRQESERKAQMEEEAARLGQVTQVLKGLASSVPEGQRMAAFQRAAPLLARFGLDVNELATTTEDELSNESLSMLIGNIEQAAQQFTLGPGMKRFDDEGNLIAEAPFAPQYRSVGEGQTLVEVEPGGETRPIMSKPKTYAPVRRGGGGRSSAAPKPPAGFIVDP